MNMFFLKVNFITFKNGMSPPSVLRSPLLLLLLVSLDFSWSIADCPSKPDCEKGYILEGCECIRCPKGQYWLLKRGRPTCERCTGPCTGVHLTQKTDCSHTENRVCHCEVGFYCFSSAQYTCRRCRPCPLETFSNVTSLKENCQPYTDCTGPGMTVISEGTKTQDRMCAYASSSSAPTTSTVDPESEALPTAEFPSQSISVLPDLVSSSVPTGPLHNANNYTEVVQIPMQHYHQPYHWSLIFVCVLLLVVAMASSLKWYQCQRLKGLLEYWGLSFRKCEIQGNGAWLGSLTSERAPCEIETGGGPKLEGAGPVPDGRQQVTVEYSGGGESVNNTVGSIYIYSPRMVVLGANSAEPREEPGESDETQALTGAPQQESCIEPSGWEGLGRGPVGECMQESMELSYPVPVTGK